MKNFILLIIFCLLFTALGYAQSASGTWTLTSDTLAVVTGNVTASVQALADTMSVKDFTGGAVVSPAERIWRSNLNWPTETAQNNNRYIQYTISPSPGNSLSVTSISLNIGCSGTTGHFFAGVFWSIDSTFSTRTKLDSALTLPDIRTVAMTSLSYTLNTTVDDGKTFYLRVYPWYNTTPSASKYVCLRDVVISGSTVSIGTPTIIVSPASLSFDSLNINTSKIKTYSLSGSYLTPSSGTITVTAPTAFMVSTSSGSGFASSIDVPYSGGTLSATTIYTNFTPPSIADYSGIITNAGGGATTQNVSVSGKGVASDVIIGIFVSPTGSDTNSGTYDRPFLTIPKAVSVAHTGDTIFVRGGTYSLNTTITISPSGTSIDKYYLFAYPYDSNRPVLDFSSMNFGSSNRGVIVSGQYWHIKGLDIYRAGDNGMYINGSNNTIEFCTLHDNRDAGLQLGNGASNNKIINCDAYFNYDDSSSTPGGNADGFSPKLDVGTGNYFYGCRSWQNSDDGWDGYLSTSNNVTTTIENCWSFENGYLKDGITTNTFMNGNGFKMGGSSAYNLIHNMILKNCLSFQNKSKGFDQNHTKGSITILNCTAYSNTGKNFSVPETLAVSAGKILTVENCISAGTSGGVTLLNPTVLLTNSWMSPFTAPTDADFMSVDTTGVRGPRKADGRLPDITFMHLASGSQFIDAGTDVGLPYNGNAPDLGAFESNGTVDVTVNKGTRITSFQLGQNYPNPFNPTTIIPFTVGKTGVVKLNVYNLLGQRVTELYHNIAEAGKEYRVTFDAKNLPTGIYYYSLESGGQRIVKRMVLLK